MKAIEFYNEAMKCRYINALAATAQSALETGYWTSLLWNKSFNGAGIKAGATWGGEICVVSSPEFVNGEKITKRSTFRAYASVGEFLSDYEKKIKKDYPKSAKSADNVWGYLAGLDRWATDPRYFGKLVMNVIRVAPLALGDNYMQKLNSAFVLAVKRGTLSVERKHIVEQAVKA